MKMKPNRKVSTSCPRASKVESATPPVTLIAARLHGPKDLRIEPVLRPAAPTRGEVLVRVGAVGICGSDLHWFTHGRIASSRIRRPFTLGHEATGIIEQVGSESLDGCGLALKPGMRVVLEPAQHCEDCEPCRRGHPNLCLHVKFCGSHPDDGFMTPFVKLPAGNCYQLPEHIDERSAVMLEPLCIALQALDLSRVRVGSSVAIVGAGPIGLCLLQAAKLAGATRVYVTDKLPWRLALAKRLGGITVDISRGDPVANVLEQSEGRGVDVAFEAAWADASLEQCGGMLRNGGTLVLVGIPEQDGVQMKYSTIRRGLSIHVVRRAKHAFVRAIGLAAEGRVNLGSIVSHEFALSQVVQAFAVNTAYQDKVIKVVVRP